MTVVVLSWLSLELWSAQALKLVSVAYLEKTSTSLIQTAAPSSWITLRSLAVIALPSVKLRRR